MSANHRQYIMDRVRVEERGFGTPCWTWLMSRRGYGYGQSTIRHAKGGNIASHRVAFAAFRGPIPDGLCLDHLCNNRDCCNQDHLEPVTRAENTRRGNAQRAARGEYGVPIGPRAETRPSTSELMALGKALSSVKRDRNLTLKQIGAVMGRSGQMIHNYLAGTAEPGAIAWRRAEIAWPELEARLIYELDEAEKAFRARQRALPLTQPVPQERAA